MGGAVGVTGPALAATEMPAAAGGVAARYTRSFTGDCSVLAGGETLRGSIDAWGPEPTTIATMRAIKAHFDPAGILAPGRYVGAI